MTADGHIPRGPQRLQRLSLSGSTVVILRAHPPLLLDHPQHLVFRGDHAQQHIWVSLAGLQYRAQRGSFPCPVFSLGVLISQGQRKIEVSLEGQSYHKSSCHASPSGGHSLLCKYPQELWANQQNLASASSSLLMLNGVGV